MKFASVPLFVLAAAGTAHADGGFTKVDLYDWKLDKASLLTETTPLIADLDGDGDQDLLTWESKNGLEWLENQDGKATRMVARRNKKFDAQHDGSVVVADLNGDGKPDILAASNDEGPVIWWNKGKSWKKENVGGKAYVSNVWVADMNGDNKPDILRNGPSDEVGLQWFENKGNGKFAKEAKTIHKFGPRQAVVADFDGDGDQDVAADIKGVVTLLVNNGGSFAEKPMAKAAGVGMLRNLSGADADGDGDIDLIGCDEDSGAVFTWTNNKGTLSGKKAFAPPAPQKCQRAKWADINKDGKQDAFVVSSHEEASAAGGIAWWKNAGGSFTRNEMDKGADGWKGHNAAVGDLNGDGKVDLVTNDEWASYFYFWKAE